VRICAHDSAACGAPSHPRRPPRPPHVSAPHTQRSSGGRVESGCDAEPADEASLRAAAHGVLHGLAALHAAGQGVLRETWLAGLAVAPPQLQTAGEAAEQRQQVSKTKYPSCEGGSTRTHLLLRRIRFGRRRCDGRGRVARLGDDLRLKCDSAHALSRVGAVGSVARARHSRFACR
jgi:hypothetical protein